MQDIVAIRYGKTLTTNLVEALLEGRQTNDREAVTREMAISAAKMTGCPTWSSLVTAKPILFYNADTGQYQIPAVKKQDQLVYVCGECGREFTRLIAPRSEYRHCGNTCRKRAVRRAKKL